MKIFEDKLGIYHIHTAFSYANIGMMYRELGEYKESMNYNLKAIKIFQDILGKAHAMTALAYMNIGSVICL